MAEPLSADREPPNVTPDGVNITVVGVVNVDVVRVAKHEIEHLCEAGDQEQLWFGLGSVFMACTLFFLGPLVAPGDLPPMWSALCHLGTLAFGLLFGASLIAWLRQRRKRIRRRNAIIGSAP